MKRLLLLTLLASGCANHLPPHTWIPVEHVEAVDLFWWPEQQECDLRVIYRVAQDDYRGFTIFRVDPQLCGYPTP